MEIMVGGRAQEFLLLGECIGAVQVDQFTLVPTCEALLAGKLLAQELRFWL